MINAKDMYIIGGAFPRMGEVTYLIVFSEPS
jgi:hypothetical protein